MREELASLEENEIWDLVNRPVNTKVIQNRWVMHIKMSCDGSACFKARLVAKVMHKNKELIVMKLLVL